MEVVGWGECGIFLMRERWGSDIFDDLLGRGSEFSISHHEKSIINLPLLLQFQIIFFSTKIHSQNI